MNTPIVSIRSAPQQQVVAHTPGHQPCVFLDRDGVMNKSDVFVNSPQDLDKAIYTDQLHALADLQKQTHIPLVVVTNQGGIDTGHMSDATAHAILERLEQRFEEQGGHFDAIYYCPDGPRFKAPAGEVSARKPQPGMLLQGARDLNVDLADSYMIGDMTTDIAAGAKADTGVTTILVQTGFGGKDGKVAVTPSHVSKDLAAACQWIEQREATPEAAPSGQTSR